MNRPTIALSFLALALPAATAGAATFYLQATGTADYVYVNGVPGGCDPYADDPLAFDLCSNDGMVQSVWNTTLTIATSSSADGTYSGSSLKSVVFTKPLDGFSIKGTDTPVFDEVLWKYVGPGPGFSVTLAGGRVTSIDLYYDYPVGQFYTYGLRLGENNGYRETDSDGWSFDGTAVQVASTVPEPPRWLTLLAGLAFTAAASRRLQSHRRDRPDHGSTASGRAGGH